MDHRVVVISAPSGTGKTTLNKKLLSEFEDLEMSVSYTTRKKRPNELEGRDYYFVSEADFKNKIAAGDMIEWAEVFGCFYGTSQSELDRIQASKKSPILEIDVQGWEQVKNKVNSVVSVFILPPSFQTLWQRLEGRATDSAQSRWRRILTAKNEIERAGSYGNFVINDDFSSAYNQLVSIVVEGKSSVLSHEEGVAHCKKLIEEFENSEWIHELAGKFVKGF